jgi:hypothetical protein
VADSPGDPGRTDFRIELGVAVAFPLNHRFALEARAAVGYQPSLGREQGTLGLTGDSGLALLLRWQ